MSTATTVKTTATLASIRSIFPPVAQADYNALRDDIKRNGQLVPILVKGENIIDGFMRMQICHELNIQPIVHELGESANDADCAVSSNLFRRHLTTGQRAFIGEKLASLRKGSNQHTADAACTRKDASKIVGVSEDSIDRARKIVEMGSANLIDMVKNGKVSLDAAAKLVKEVPDHNDQNDIIAKGVAVVKKAKYKQDVLDVKRAKAIKLGENNVAALQTLSGKYSVIYADPPWDYGGNNEGSFCDPSVYYPLMSTAKIMELPVKACLADDAAILLWTPNCLLEDGLAVLKAWGFSYVSMMVWCKNRPVMSMGPTKTSHETLLIGRKGTAMHIIEQRLNSWVVEEAGVHSKKPEIFANMIDAMYPGLPKLEMFARAPRSQDWSVFGNEVVVVEGSTPTSTDIVPIDASPVSECKANALAGMFAANDPRLQLAA